MHKIVEAGPSTQSNDSDDSLPAVASGDDEPSKTVQYRLPL